MKKHIRSIHSIHRWFVVDQAVDVCAFTVSKVINNILFFVIVVKFCARRRDARDTLKAILDRRTNITIKYMAIDYNCRHLLLLEETPTTNEIKS